jgi:TetR/AcrR family transcriptional repressor of nem operon
LNKLPDSIKERIKALDDYELDWVTQVMREGIENKEFCLSQPHKDPRALASLFIFSCKGALYYARLHGKEQFHQTMQQFEYLVKSK